MNDPWVYLRAMLCLIVAVGYLALLAVTYPKSVLPPLVRNSAAVFLLCACAKNVGLALHVYYSDWFLFNELIQAASIVIFMGGIYRILSDMRTYHKDRFGGPQDTSEDESDVRR